MFRGLEVSRVWMGFPGEMDPRVNLDSKGNLQKRASRVSVGHLETLVLLGLQESGGHPVCQALAAQDNLERRAVRGDLDLMELLDHLGSKVSRAKV